MKCFDKGFVFRSMEYIDMGLVLDPPDAHVCKNEVSCLPGFLTYNSVYGESTVTFDCVLFDLISDHIISFTKFENR